MMPENREDIKYICSRKELETIFEAACTTAFEILDYPVNAPELRVIRREIKAAVEDWCHWATMLVPQPRRVP